MPKGKFITLEGGEGTGKSTQARLLADCFKASGLPVMAVRSPGGTPVAEKLRTILKVKDASDELTPETELLLFGACHSQMVENLLLPNLEKGINIICDRFFDSTTVYQGFGRGLPLEKVRAVNKFSCRGVMPDLTILLDIPPEAGLDRRKSDTDIENDRFDSESMRFHETVRNGFLSLAGLEPGRFRIVASTGEKEDTARKVKEAVANALGLALI